MENETAGVVGTTCDLEPAAERIAERAVVGIHIQPIPEPNLDPPEPQPDQRPSAPPNEIDLRIARAYLASLREKSAADATQFPSIIRHGMNLVDDDGALLDVFHISRATLKRWRSGETMPGQLARDSVIGRMDRFICARFGLVAADTV